MGILVIVGKKSGSPGACVVGVLGAAPPRF